MPRSVASLHYLNEDNLVVLLGLGYWDGSLRPELFGFWWGNVDVDVFLDGGATSEAAAESATESAAASAATTETWNEGYKISCLLTITSEINIELHSKILYLN